MTHPIYRADLRRTSAYALQRSSAAPTGARGTGLHNWILIALIFIAIAIILPNFFASIPELALSGLGIFLFGSTWIGYVQMALRTSRIIIEEREKQTWELLLTIPFAWEDLILAKLAAALRTFSVNLLLWLQGIFLVGLFAIAIYQEAAHFPFLPDQNLSHLPDTLLNYLPIFVVTLIGFTVGRLQDVILISLMGAIISLVSPNRQIATVVAIFAGIAYLLINAFLIVLALPWIAGGALFFRGELLAGLAAVGPTGSLLVGLPILGAILAVAAIILVREIVIRTLFGWLTRHLAGG